MNKRTNSIKYRKTAHDKIYTPLPVAKRMIEVCNIQSTDKVLDCSLGGGVFYNNLPECNKYWCEIDDEIVGENKKDFFDFTDKVDLVIGNPPYSIWDKWLDHTMEITDKFCYIYGFLNLTHKRLHKILQRGFGMTFIELLNVEWWFGRHFIIIFERNKQSLMSVISESVLCDICNKRCKRGLQGNDFNKCTNIN
jgi:hypothetical protein